MNRTKHACREEEALKEAQASIDEGCVVPGTGQRRKILVRLKRFEEAAALPPGGQYWRGIRSESQTEADDYWADQIMRAQALVLLQRDDEAHKLLAPIADKAVNARILSTLIEDGRARIFSPGSCSMRKKGLSLTAGIAGNYTKWGMVDDARSMLTKVLAEQFNLTWGSIEWQLGPNGEGAIRIEQQRRGRLVGGQPWKPKSRRNRVVPLSARARELLEKVRGDVIPRADSFVFPNTHGSPYVRLQTATKGTGPSAWRMLKEEQGHDVTWHDLRHAFAVRCLNANVPIATLSTWLGHSDINLTVKRYGRFAAESHEQWRQMNLASRNSDARPQSSDRNPS